ncbi:hypothetical protein [Aliterella atlantica]|nr:hypothetical protein [Aliterella atlantica]
MARLYFYYSAETKSYLRAIAVLFACKERSLVEFDARILEETSRIR